MKFLSHFVVHFLIVSLLAVFANGCASNPSDSSLETPEEDAVEASNGSSYMDYSAEEYDSLKGATPFVLSFHADWCPTCQKIKGEILEDLDAFPAETMILEADYDAETALKSEYGVTTQTTFLVFDAEGTVVQTLVAPTLENLIEAVEAAMPSVESMETVDTVETDEVVVHTSYTAATYDDYTAEIYQRDQGSVPMVLYFHADWCPVCQSTRAAILSELSSFPNGTNILETDYDAETDLKAQYGVTTQTTFVILDSDGNVVNKLVVPSTGQLKAAITNSL